MTGTPIASLHWRALDREGEDTCRLVRLDAGWMLIGHARFRDGPNFAALDYVIRCGLDWLTSSADITGTFADASVSLRILRSGLHWTLNGAPQPDVQGATDIDLGFTPATNLMPLRRLPEIGRIATRAAWLRGTDAALSPLDQTYTRARGGLVEYSAEQTNYATQLVVNPQGFVTRYPGLWEVSNDR
ncbi:putative glycolipid-binding domain-containing protein [Puniceibacterium sp. IMCC21224]|uniref:putative glycolipid-binding domain-containing protein n=1 Tax=Puniceibacterium sp. IMCC21224 TaxID=1618204 RepID=UPI00064DF4E7|nr:putative glycolipid-binding domain-containing protein [Puniceibacterium sp. IMCC21224]KMK65934.1 hypothetical protein IMCC21224_11777 [Puniceibacterium sp. IMCC21224]